MATTSKQEARARLMQARATAAAERQARERQNITDLTQFVVQTGNVDEVDGWLAARIEKLRGEADARRERFRVAAGRALAALRARGESVASIAGQAGISQAKVREYLKLADDAGEQETDTPKSAKPRAAGPDVGGDAVSAPAAVESAGSISDQMSAPKVDGGAIIRHESRSANA